MCVDPDKRDEPLSPRVKDIKPYVAKYFKGVSTTPSIYEACIFTVRCELLYNVRVHIFAVVFI